MHSFEVHSNESSCRKNVRLGLEQVNDKSHTNRERILQLPLRKNSLNKKGRTHKRSSITIEPTINHLEVKITGKRKIRKDSTSS